MIDLKLTAPGQVVPVPAPGRIMLHADAAGDMAIKDAAGNVAKLARVAAPPNAVPVVLTLTASGSANGTATAAHGVAASKISGASAACLLASGAVALPGDAAAANLYTLTIGATAVNIKNGAGATAIYGRQVKVTLWVMP